MLRRLVTTLNHMEYDMNARRVYSRDDAIGAPQEPNRTNATLAGPIPGTEARARADKLVGGPRALAQNATPLAGSDDDDGEAAAVASLAQPTLEAIELAVHRALALKARGGRPDVDQILGALRPVIERALAGDKPAMDAASTLPRGFNERFPGAADMRVVHGHEVRIL